ncbi:di-heme oxidoredictase family protein [Vibrio rumoiensis]|uniref:Thiol oxidoreductase n=1 Tax=Vibrio rumoiensis 1S-45 TaxID=1188252 RepID=A0A1E5E5M4_9VIBR|nr:di-heme oxidoredictase family protein [Vibrio rumoiensis]OEF29190.1 thiol oxidoreductase [Vibrio rumoiensis 1S-45]
MKLSFLTTLLCFTLPTTAFAYGVKSGGDTSTNKQGSNAFSMPSNNLPISKRLDFSVGNSFFRNPWVQAPATTDARDGLGPLFNTNGCQNCHIKDGRGHPPEEGEDQAVSMLVRMSIPALTDAQKQQLIQSGVIPEPTYGDQLEDFAIPNAKPEGKIKIEYEKFNVTFSDGEKIELRKPKLILHDLNYGELHPDTMLSARVAPPMIGLGLLESISVETLQQLAELQAKEGKGISGKLNQVWDAQTQSTAVGRFGWKAGQPTLIQQDAAAFNGDLGLTSTLFPTENCSPKQTICAELPNGNSPDDENVEVSNKIMNFVEFYSQHLAVPIRRSTTDSSVLRGQELFEDVGCASCHTPEIKTAKREELPSLSEQTIHPYTDMLLHDMGEGLADHRPEFLATGTEWRTPPLWGLGYTEEVNGHTYFLHDGRARNAMEAVLWHGGEAQAAKNKVLNLSKADRTALIAFLNSL